MGVPNCKFPDVLHDLSQSFFTGYALKIESLKVTKNFLSGWKTSASGNAINAYWGNTEAPAHIFHFCLTNSRFQKICLEQHTLEQRVHERRFIEAPLNSVWSIKLEIGKEALQWLDAQVGNIGIRLTGLGLLFQPIGEEVDNDFPTSLTTITLIEAEKMLEKLFWLMSYAIGGFVSPIFIEGVIFPGIHTVSAQVMTDYTVTALEQLGRSWLMEKSDLKDFISCFSNFDKMLTQPFWMDTFHFVIVQYFQAIRGGNWKLASSATGAALERLSHAILVEDETDPTRRAACELLYDVTQSNLARTTWNLGKQAGQENISITGKRLRLLLERIGLTSSRGYNDMQDVQAFLDVRNDAVHPKVGSMTQNQRWQLIYRGIQWIDEVLLWRLGYDGKYLDRITKAARVFSIGTTVPLLPPLTSSSLEISPRYDLSLRDPSW